MLESTVRTPLLYASPRRSMELKVLDYLTELGFCQMDKACADWISLVVILTSSEKSPASASSSFSSQNNRTPLAPSNAQLSNIPVVAAQLSAKKPLILSPKRVDIGRASAALPAPVPFPTMARSKSENGKSSSSPNIAPAFGVPAFGHTSIPSSSAVKSESSPS
jgi:hypothetical protein